MSYIDLETEFSWRKTQFYWVAEQIIHDSLLKQRHIGMLQLYKAAVVDGVAEQILTTLDKGTSSI